MINIFKDNLNKLWDGVKANLLKILILWKSYIPKCDNCNCNPCTCGK